MPHVALLKSQVHCTCMHGLKITICGNILMVSARADKNVSNFLPLSLQKLMVYPH